MAIIKEVIAQVIVVLSIVYALGLCLVETKESSLSIYITHVMLPAGKLFISEDLVSWYEPLLPTTDAGPTKGRPLIHCCKNFAARFAAKLIAQKARALEEKDQVLHVMEENVLLLHTTHTTAFLGLHRGLGLRNPSNLGKGTLSESSAPE